MGVYDTPPPNKYNVELLKNEYHGNALHTFVYVYIREISVSHAHSLYNLHNIKYIALIFHKFWSFRRTF